MEKTTNLLSLKSDWVFKRIFGKEGNEDILGDMVISIEQVKKQAEEYGHGFERELAYMVVHSFYHLLRLWPYKRRRQTNNEAKGRKYIKKVRNKEITLWKEK